MLHNCNTFLQISQRHKVFQDVLDATMETKFEVTERYTELTNSLTLVVETISRVVRFWELSITKLIQIDFDVHISKIEQTCGLIRELLQKIGTCVKKVEPAESEPCELDLSADNVQTVSSLWASAEQLWYTITLEHPEVRKESNVEVASKELQRALRPKAPQSGMTSAPISLMSGCGALSLCVDVDSIAFSLSRALEVKIIPNSNSVTAESSISCDNDSANDSNLDRDNSSHHGAIIRHCYRYLDQKRRRINLAKYFMSWIIHLFKNDEDIHHVWQPEASWRGILKSPERIGETRDRNTKSLKSSPNLIYLKGPERVAYLASRHGIKLVNRQECASETKSTLQIQGYQKLLMIQRSNEQILNDRQESLSNKLKSGNS